MQSVHTNAFLIDCKQSRHPSYIELSYAQMCIQNIAHTLSWDGDDLNFLTHFHFQVI